MKVEYEEGAEWVMMSGVKCELSMCVSAFM